MAAVATCSTTCDERLASDAVANDIAEPDVTELDSASAGLTLQVDEGTDTAEDTTRRAGPLRGRAGSRAQQSARPLRSKCSYSIWPQDLPSPRRTNMRLK